MTTGLYELGPMLYALAIGVIRVGGHETAGHTSENLLDRSRDETGVASLAMFAGPVGRWFPPRHPTGPATLDLINRRGVSRT